MPLFLGRILMLVALLFSSAISMAVTTGFNPDDTPVRYEYISGAMRGPIISAHMLKCTVLNKSEFAGCAAKAIASANSKNTGGCTQQLAGFSDLVLTTIDTDVGTFTYQFTHHLWVGTTTQKCSSTIKTDGFFGNYKTNTICPKTYTRDGTMCRAPMDKNRGDCRPGQCCNTKVGDPIDIRNGNVTRKEVDVALAGGGLTFSRYYVST